MHDASAESLAAPSDPPHGLRRALLGVAVGVAVGLVVGLLLPNEALR